MIYQALYTGNTCTSCGAMLTVQDEASSKPATCHKCRVLAVAVENYVLTKLRPGEIPAGKSRSAVGGRAKQ